MGSGYTIDIQRGSSFGMKNRHIIAAGLLLSVAPFVRAGAYEEALRAYQHTDYSSAVAKLSGAQDARSLVLLGQSYYMNGDYKKATDVLERAVSLNDKDSDAYLWLGRAFGRRAETAFPVAAPSYAAKARANFENSVALNPRNSEAVNDLFEYYLEAPGFLGGGIDRASKLVDVIAQNDPAEASYARARIAMHRKQYDTAEQQLRHAVQLAPQQLGRILDLASFLAKRGKFGESDQTFARARQIAPDAPKLLYAQARALIESNRDLSQAREMLKKYLSATISPDDPSKQDAEKLLKKVSGS
jgi:tetratricopeptide (TPR) repeat protein